MNAEEAAQQMLDLVNKQYKPSEIFSQLDAISK
jgi:hypothetical protein